MKKKKEEKKRKKVSKSYRSICSLIMLCDPCRYWQQRHTIFSNYNEGVYMTHDAWYGVTPEPVAM